VFNCESAPRLSPCAAARPACAAAADPGARHSPGYPQFV